MEKRLMDPGEAGTWLGGVSTRTLANWRSRSLGPRYTKLNNGLVRYRLEDLEAYAAAGVVATLAA